MFVNAVLNLLDSLISRFRRAALQPVNDIGRA
jgi:hypothetical protein